MLAAADADVVVEAIFERVEAKHEVFRALDKICKAHNGLWSVEAEDYLLSHAESLD